MRALHAEELSGPPVEQLEVEMVERKGKGHPDCLIDGCSEAVSRALCNYYLRRYGHILHHNVDKGLLVGGRSRPVFGGGEVLEPIHIIVAGRATAVVNRDGEIEVIPIGGIALKAIKEHLKSSLRYLSVEEHVIIDYKIKQGSSDLMAIFSRGDKIPLSNDTSIGVGFAPLTPTEHLVLETEKLLNSSELKARLPEIGEDIKVMALRRNRRVKLTIGMAMVSRLIPDASHYISVVEEAKNRVADLASKWPELDVEVKINVGDCYERGEYYLTVTGTSAEAGDDGNTGRGNKSIGLITPMRQHTMEATAGKNPVNHTGKIFSILAQGAAERIQKEVKGIREVYVRILSQIGSPIDEPQLASVAFILEKGASPSSVKRDALEILNEELSNVKNVTHRILKGEVSLF